MSIDNELICSACGSKMNKKLTPWLLCCNNCELWTSLLGEKSSKLKDSLEIIEENRNNGLKSLRIQNFHKLLNTLESYMDLNGARVCDVGCSYGWFLEVAAMRGMLPTGVEPEESVALMGINRNLNIKIGYFPDCMNSLDQFDVIIFNDCLEHLYDIKLILENCYKMLFPGGKLVINIPNSQGFFFKLALILYRFGYKEPFHRLWQKDYKSPHIFYFNSNNLEKCITRYGFKLLKSQSLQTISLVGLWKRLRMDNKSLLINSAITYILLVTIYPLLNLLPSDILLQIYEKH